MLTSLFWVQSGSDPYYEITLTLTRWPLSSGGLFLFVRPPTSTLWFAMPALKWLSQWIESSYTNRSRLGIYNMSLLYGTESHKPVTVIRSRVIRCYTILLPRSRLNPVTKPWTGKVIESSHCPRSVDCRLFKVRRFDPVTKPKRPSPKQVIYTTWFYAANRHVYYPFHHVLWLNSALIRSGTQIAERSPCVHLWAGYEPWLVLYWNSTCC